MDILTHITDLQAFRLEVIEKQLPEFSLNEDGSITFIGLHIPVNYNGNESISLVRVSEDSLLTTLDTVDRLGICDENKEYVFDSPETKATYERVTGRKEVYEQGEIKLPYRIGVFL